MRWRREKFPALPGIEPRSSSPYCSHYTDRDILVLIPGITEKITKSQDSQFKTAYKMEHLDNVL
jgi:hypothetical protein